jgi:hypothetical protein
MGLDGLDSFSLGQGTLAGSCEHVNEPFHKSGKLLVCMTSTS